MVNTADYSRRVAALREQLFPNRFALVLSSWHTLDAYRV
jgi:hypothetical protein